MDDLYDNLENYHDENIIHELKIENEDLKRKLEEYSTTMLRLQNDFDKLNTEYKKLEMNYSSLLKTAHAEIERKSEMIKSLNSEKDLLIIKSLQRSSQNIKNPKRFNVHDTQRSNKSCGTDIKDIEKPPSEPLLSNQNGEKLCKNERINPTTHRQFQNRTANVENKSNSKEDQDTHIRNKTDTHQNDITKESHKDDLKQKNPNTKGEKISNRRKSMPMSRIEPIFSSDDDFEALNMKNIRKSPLKDDTRQYERYNNKDNYYHSSKDRFYNNKSNRSSDYKYRHDRYDSSSKYARHSPEKFNNKNIKDYSDTHKLRNDYENRRQRIPSPPSPPKYSRSKSRDRRYFDRENYYEKKRQTPCDNSAVKHKIRNELEEPIRKRQKTEIVRMGLPEENIYINDKEKEIELTGSYVKQQDYMEPSCQSPDYVNIDSTVAQHIAKEIKHTALTPQEDPRMASKKYVLKDIQKEKVLSTVTSQHVDIKPVNIAIWDIPNIKKFMISHTSTKHNLPVEINKQLMDEVRMDVNNPILSDSLESGEIQSLNEYDNSFSKENDTDKINENENKHQNEKLSNTKSYDTNKTKNTSGKKYKIPKIKKLDTISNGVKYDRFPSEINKFRCNENKEEEINHHSKAQAIQPTPINVENNTTDGKYKHKVAKINATAVLPKTARDTLADDLELSDEECKDLQKHVITSKSDLIENKDTRKNNIPVGVGGHGELKEKSKPIDYKDVKISKNDLIEDKDTRKNYNGEEEHCKSKEKSKPIDFKDVKTSMADLIEHKNTKNINNPLCGGEHCESKEKSKPPDFKKVTKETRDNVKTRKSKKKMDQKQASHTEAKELLVSISNKPVLSIQTKNKFSDLFGDSSSLITPDDLGIPPVIQLPLIDKYASIFDNTQDAVDLCVDNIKKGECNANEAPCELSSNKIILDSGKTLVPQNVNLAVLGLDENATINDGSETVETVTSSATHTKCASDILQSKEKVEIDHTANINNGNMCMLKNIKALATSTPHKADLENVPRSIPNHSVPNDDTRITENSNLSLNANNSSNPDEILCQSDVPDVRLIVKRRRKIVKRPH